MKNGVVFFVLLVSALFVFPAREIDLDKPLAKDADRVLKLSEVFSIDGLDSDDYFLKAPRKPVWSFDGEFLLLADQDQLLRFDKNGVFQGNLYKKGEGPGEWGFTVSLLADGNGFSLLSNSPHKLLTFDRNFNFNDEIKFSAAKHLMRLVRHLPGGGHLFSVKIDFGKIKSGIFYNDHPLQRYDREGQVSESALSFKQKVHNRVVRSEQGVQVAFEFLTPFSFALAPAAGCLLLASQDEYRLELVDLNEEKRVVSLVRPQYSRQRWQPDPQRKRLEDAPKIDYFNDVQAVVARGEEFWVLTSSLDPQKGVQVDVISSSGAYLDRFWLPLPGLDYPRLAESLAVSADRIAWIHQDEDDNPVLKVYSYSLR